MTVNEKSNLLSHRSSALVFSCCKNQSCERWFSAHKEPRAKTTRNTKPTAPLAFPHTGPPPSGANGAAAAALAVPAEEAPPAPAAAGRGLSRVKKLLLRLIEVEIDTVSVEVTGCRTAESATERLSLVLPGIRTYTERSEDEGESRTVDLCVQSRHTISLFCDSAGELPPHRALKMGSCSARARMARSGALVSCKVEVAEPIEVRVNAAVLTTALQLADFAKSQRSSEVKSQPAAEATALPLEVSAGRISASAHLGGQTEYVPVVSLVILSS